MHTKAYLTAFWRMLLGLSLLFSAASCDADFIPEPPPTQGTARPSAAAPTSTRAGPPLPPAASTTLTPLHLATRPPATPALSVTPADLSGVTITFWHPWDGEAGETLRILINEFNRSNRYGVRIQAQAFAGPEALEEALQAARQPGGALPDLLMAYPHQSRHLDAGGQVLVDLNAYASDPTWGFTPIELEDFYPQFLTQDTLTLTLTDQGPVIKRLGLPFYRSLFFIIYNETWAGELGYDEPPNLPFNLRTQACAAAAQSGGDEPGMGGWMITDSGSMDDQAANPPAALLLGWIAAFGGQIERADGTGYQLNTPEVERAMSLLKGLQDSGCAWLARDLDPAAEFAARRALFYAASLADLPAQSAAMSAAANRDRWTVLPFPSGNGGPAVDAYGPALVITRSTAERQTAAWLLLKWLLEPPNQARWAIASGYAPVRPSALELMEDELGSNPQWAAALALLPYAHPEPSYPSWSVVRGMLADALKQLLTPDFPAGQIPNLMQTMELLAEEIHSQIR